MPNGLYGKASPGAGAVVKLTSSAVPAGKNRTVVIGAVNTTDNQARISIAFAATEDPNSVPAGDWKVSRRPLGPSAEYERTHQLLVEGENVFIKSDIAGVNFDVRGYEGAA